MKKYFKQGIAILMILAMVLCVLPATAVRSAAATYTYNWGTRGKLATELSDAAVAWYEKYSIELSNLMNNYSGASSTSSVPSSTLYTKLQDLMTTAHSYKNGYSANNTLLAYTDCQNGGGAISSFYSGDSIGPGWDSGSTWNKEHTWPNSKGLGGSDEDDVMMIRPTKVSENSNRGNTAYGEGSSYYDPNKVSGGTYNLHGDVARIMLYVYVRWGNTQYMWGTSGVMESKDVLLKWMEEDPVDTWELGRNDAVQSITGTRNVFVDYPELGFALFNEDVPADYDSPSGGAAPAYTITASSNNTAYGTVSLSGKTITATPKTGYYASGYTVTSGSATVTQNGNVFTVSASSDCSIRINFAAKTQHTVTYMAAGSTYSTSSAYSEDEISISAYTGTVPEGFAFKGWVTGTVEDTTEKPTTVYAAGDSYTVTANTTFYALYSYSEDGANSGTGDFVKVTEEPSDWSGEYLVVYESAGYILDGSLSSFDKSGNYQEVSINNNTISATEGDPYKFIVSANSSGYSFQGTSGMYFGASSAKNSLNTSGTALVNTLSLNSDGSAAIKGTGGYVLRFNTGDKRFRYYNGTQAAIALYVKDGTSGTTYYTTNPINCAHSDTSDVSAVAPTCTETGFTAGVYCNDCESYISGHEVVPAAGHSWGTWVQITAPGCTTAGVEKRECANCDETETQSVAATGHSYTAAVTPPTTYDQGYTTYTCSVCGHTYVADYVDALGETFIVNFRVPAGVAAVTQMECGKSGITLPSAGVPTGDYEYAFVGWTTDSVDNTTEEPTVYKAGSAYTATANTTLIALYSYKVVTDGSGSSNGDYVKVTETPADWSGEYVIVYEANGYIFNSSLTTFDAVNNYKSVTITDNTIAASEADPYKFIINAIDGGYSIQGTSGKYIGNASNSNALTTSSTALKNSISLDASGNANIIGAGGAYLRFNANSGQNRFRYYKSSSYTGQKAIALYVKSGNAATTYYTTVFACDHSYETVIIEPTYIKPGCKTETCSVCGDVITTEIPVLDSPVESWNIYLSDNIGVNFQLALAETDVVAVTVADKSVETAMIDGMLSVEVAAAQMTDQIAITVNGLPLNKTYSVREYADVILSGAYSDATKELVEAMLVYGGASQTVFGYNTGNLASDEAAAVTVPTETVGAELEGTVSGVNFYGASLVYRNKTAVRFYFTGNCEGLCFTVDGNAYTPVAKDNMYYIEITGINPQNLDQDIKAVVSNDTETLSVSYGPMDYIIRMYNKADTSKNTKSLMQALYGYYLAAEAYVADSNEEQPTPDDVFG